MRRKPTKLEKWLDGITQIADPCKMCEFVDKDGIIRRENIEICQSCCWYYPSQFKERK